MFKLVKSFFMFTLMCSLVGHVLAAEPTEQEAKSDAFVSGIPLDQPIDTFNVLAVSGPSKGRTLCYACQYGGKPVIAVFFKKIDKPVVELLAAVNETAHSFENKKLRAFGIYLTDEPDSARSELEKLAAEHGWENLPLTVYDGEEGPVNYQIKDRAAVNVMMWVKARVKANHAYQSLDELTKKERQQILQDTEKILPQ
ncbi:MAG: hypothetical protein KDA65_09670 [Planctomycetaceae bacterium]|nr:hypothetical protein [Planctomycetaceae bacterium]